MNNDQAPELLPSNIRWQRVNDEPFEYAIQQGRFGDEFVKLLDGTCLRRPTPAERSVPQVREALEACREFLVGMTKPATVGVMSISSYHPCQALIDKIDAALTARPSDAPVAWRYELAHVGWSMNSYEHWNWHLSETKPHVPEGSIRNLTPLSALPPDEPARVTPTVGEEAGTMTSEQTERAISTPTPNK